jgi:outer membrane receptor for ferrienterochelin and colicins
MNHPSRILFFTIFIFTSFILQAQNSLKIVVSDSTSHELIIGAAVQIAKTSIGNATNTEGVVVLDNIPMGKQTLIVSFIGYKTVEKELVFPRTETENTLVISLAAEAADLEEVTVTTTRSNSRIEDSPTKVEVLGAEEMHEENGIKPGNVASILGDISSIQIQQTSAVSGNANVRIQGLDGKYTQLLRDGMPVYDGFAGGFGILQIPPLDLKQIEIIKGSSSTLYGGGAIGGIINFVSKKPSEKPEFLFTVNKSSLKETNANVFLSRKTKAIGFTLFTGFTGQNEVDVDKDGFSDVAQARVFNFHPKLFFYINPTTELNVSYTGVFDTRLGGDMIALNEMFTLNVKPTGDHLFFEQNKTNRHSVDAIFNKKMGKNGLFQIKTAYSLFDKGLKKAGFNFTGNQSNVYSEISYNQTQAKDNTVFGVNFLRDEFKKGQTDTLKIQNFNNATFGVFLQNNHKFADDKLTLESGIRLDKHNRYGWFMLPSVAALYKITDAFSLRAGFGLGYKSPNILAVTTNEYDVRQLKMPAAGLKAEKSIGGNIEWNWHKIIGEEASLYMNQSFFMTNVDNPTELVLGTEGYATLKNFTKPLVTKGIDNYVRLHIDAWEIYFGYTFTSPKKTYDTQQPYLTLTPAHRLASTLVYEIEGKWRFGIEASFNGKQYRDDGTKTPAYTFMAAMVNRHFKHFDVVLNGENLLDIRQSKFEKVVIPPLSNPTFKQLYAPLDGRVLNASCFVHF